MSDKWLQLRTGSEEMRNQAAFMLTTDEVRELLAERDALAERCKALERELPQAWRDNDAGIARIAAKLGACTKYTVNYAFDKNDMHTKLFCAASDWMDRAAHAELERDALKAALRKEKVVTLAKPDGIKCYQCNGEWGLGEPERHAPGCLAAPKDGA